MKQNSTTTHITGEWMWSDTIANAGSDGAEKVLSRCAEMGITDVYLLVKGTAGKLAYLRTKHTDLLLRDDRDILGEAICAAHTHGIRLHAWICNLEDAAYKAAHPDAGMWHYVNARDNAHINPYDPGYRAHMADIAAELAAYDIDGLHFDYIRYNHLANGWSQEDTDALTAMGADIGRIRELMETTFGYCGQPADGCSIFNAYRNGDRDVCLIAEYRRTMVRDYAASVIAAARSVRENLMISAATMPEGAYDEAFAELHYGQDYRDAATLYDYICPMAYSMSFGMDENWLCTVAKNAVQMGNRVVMGLQAFGGVSSSRLMREIEVIRTYAQEEPWAACMNGIVLFRAAQYDYAKITVGAAGDMTVKTVSSSGRHYRWVQIDMPEGIRITDAHHGRGYCSDTTVLVSPDGTSVKFFGENDITTGAEGHLHLCCEGDSLIAERLPVVRVGGEQEYLVYTQSSQDSKT